MTDVLERGRVAAAEIERLSGAILDTIPAAHRPLLLAMLERGAAKRYRHWATGAEADAERDALLACAEREESIAAVVEATIPNAESILPTFVQHLPALRDAFARVYGDSPRLEQFGVQAAAERLGARLWRSFAADQADASTRASFLRCAELEEASASYLEGLLATRTAP